jgi:hypothetical protein
MTEINLIISFTMAIVYAYVVSIGIAIYQLF